MYSFPLLLISLSNLILIQHSTASESMHNCTMEQFTCRSGKNECIALNWMCDDNPDCTDSSDEADCNSTCRSDEFTCKNKHCIQKRWVCDHDNDCGDNSDESNCKLQNCQPGKDFACSSNYCIALHWRCDGDFDCPNRLDEKGCDLSNINRIYCSNHEFDCGDHITCVHKSWLCDGDKDCPDGSDESIEKCGNMSCASDQFQCHDHKCISGHFHCDGKKDCLDFTDEVNCTEKTQTCDIDLEFECFKGKCLSLQELCMNKDINCEKEKIFNNHLCGINECLQSNGGCSHECINLPIGYKCQCNPGYKLVNDFQCTDVNECLDPSTCSQLCVNQEGSYSCNCAIGYLKDPKNSTRCKAAEGHASLLLARRYDVRKIALDRKETTSIINNTKMATALDFVFRTGMIFWSDISEKRIYKAPIDEGYERTSVINEDLTLSDGIAVDWIYNHIYWTDSNKNTINVANFDGNMRKILLSDRIQEPRAIALNPLEGWMFWTDWGDKARIEKAGMDGSYRTVIVDVDIKWPNGITLDLIKKRVYWVDAKLYTINSCDYNGFNRNLVLHSKDTLKHPFSITMFEDVIYWTDWDKETIFKANKFNGKDLESVISIKSLQHPMTVHVYHPYKQPDGINHCQYVNGHCSHLCLPSPLISKNSHLLSCACPDDLLLLADGLTCSKIEGETFYQNQNTSKIWNMGTLGTNIKTVCIIAGLLLLTLSLGMYQKCSFQKKIINMNFDNPVYKKVEENQFRIKKNRYLYRSSIGEEIFVCAFN